MDFSCALSSIPQLSIDHLHVSTEYIELDYTVSLLECFSCINHSEIETMNIPEPDMEDLLDLEYNFPVVDRLKISSLSITSSAHGTILTRMLLGSALKKTTNLSILLYGYAHVNEVGPLINNAAEYLQSLTLDVSHTITHRTQELDPDNQCTSG